MKVELHFRKETVEHPNLYIELAGDPEAINELIKNIRETMAGLRDWEEK